MKAIISDYVNGELQDVNGFPVSSIEEAAQLFGDIYIAGREAGLHRELSVLGVARDGEELPDGTRTEVVIELFNDDWTNAVDTSMTLLSPESRRKLLAE